MIMTMKVFTILELSLVLLLLISCTTSTATMFTFRNNCPTTIWPGVLTGSGSAPFPTTGFTLPPRSSVIFNAPLSWSGRLWPRTLCRTSPAGSFVCGTGDCASGNQVPCRLGAGGAPPVTLAEFTLNGAGGKDFYDISLVDGFNVPMSVQPSRPGCRATSCPGNVNGVCPPELRVLVGGRVAACKSACLAFGSPEYCCTGPYASPNACKPTRYSQIFKGRCPQAYSFAFDDRTSTFTCPSGGNYVVTFCP